MNLGKQGEAWAKKMNLLNFGANPSIVAGGTRRCQTALFASLYAQER